MRDALNKACALSSKVNKSETNTSKAPVVKPAVAAALKGVSSALLEKVDSNCFFFYLGILTAKCKKLA